MSVTRRAGAQEPEEQQLPRRVVEQIGATNHVRDPLRRIVDHHRQLIRDDPVSSEDDEVANVRAQALRVVPLNLVEQLDRFVRHL